MSENNNRTDLKRFFIKLFSIFLAVIICFNIIFNLIFGEKIDNLATVLALNKEENRDLIKDKIRLEIERGLNKKYILNEEDKVLLYKLFLKLKDEFKEIEKK